MANMDYPATQKEIDLEERAHRLCERLGVNRAKLKDVPIHLWAVPLLEKMLDAIEHLESSVYG